MPRTDRTGAGDALPEAGSGPGPRRVLRSSSPGCGSEASRKRERSGIARLPNEVPPSALRTTVATLGDGRARVSAAPAGGGRPVCGSAGSVFGRRFAVRVRPEVRGVGRRGCRLRRRQARGRAPPRRSAPVRGRRPGRGRRLGRGRDRRRHGAATGPHGGAGVWQPADTAAGGAGTPRRRRRRCRSIRGVVGRGRGRGRSLAGDAVRSRSSGPRSPSGAATGVGASVDVSSSDRSSAGRSSAHDAGSGDGTRRPRVGRVGSAVVTAGRPAPRPEPRAAQRAPRRAACCGSAGDASTGTSVVDPAIAGVGR